MSLNTSPKFTCCYAICDGCGYVATANKNENGLQIRTRLHLTKGWTVKHTPTRTLDVCMMCHPDAKEKACG